MGEDRKPRASNDNSFRGNDPRTVEIDSPAERAFWCKALFTSEEELVAAVYAVGASAQKVKEYLQAHRDPP
jgi:hypothetical protein